MARINLSDKVHVLTGQNNTGKSSLLQALQKLVFTIGFSRGQALMSGGFFVQEDLPNGSEEELIAISVCLSIDEVSDWVDNLFPNTDECGMATRASVASLFMAGAFSDVNRYRY